MIRQDQSLLKHFGCDENDCSWLSRKQMEILVEFTPFAYKNGPYLAFGICELITWSIFFFLLRLILGNRKMQKSSSPNELGIEKVQYVQLYNPNFTSDVENVNNDCARPRYYGTIIFNYRVREKKYPPGVKRF